MSASNIFSRKQHTVLPLSPHWVYISTIQPYYNTNILLPHTKEMSHL